MIEFSVIVPVYNVEQYLIRCLESLRRQTFEGYEAILVDDGSTDQSGAICDRYADMDSRFRVIHRQNGGLAAARNTGLDKAQGTYIMFLDSDDDLEKEALAKVRETMNRGHYDIASFAARRIDEDRKFLYELRFDDRVGERTFNDDSRELFLWQDFLQYKVGWEVCFHVFCREQIEKYGIRFDECVKYAEDLPFTFRYMLHVTKWVKMPDILYNYTFRNSSISKQTHKEAMVEAIMAEDYNQMCADLRGGQKELLYAALLFYFKDSFLKGTGVEEFKKLLFDSKEAQEHKKRLKKLRWKKKKLQSLYGEQQGEKFYHFICYLLR